MKKWSVLFVLFGVALAASYPNVKRIPFIKNQVIAINASTFTVTEIQFNQQEKILSIQNGDIAAWTIDVSKILPNTLFIKPTIVGSNTNMTVITNHHTYYFHLISQSLGQKTLYALKFFYPKKGVKNLKLKKSYVYSSDHWDYSFHGSKVIMPLHVFDDGHFTYFQLREGQIVPAIFIVDNRKGEESVVNYRREGSYLIVHRLSPQFTLRFGKYQVASIFNNRLIRIYQ